MKKIKIPIMLSIVAVILTACSGNDEKTIENIKTDKPAEITKIVGVARIEPEKGLLYIYSNTAGKIKNLNAEENQSVPLDYVLLNIESGTDEAQLKMEESKIIVQNSAIQSVDASAKAILSDLQKAKKDLALNEQLFNAKAITEQTINDSKAKVEKLTIEYEKQLSEVNQQKNKMLEISAGIQYRKEVLAEKNIKAAFDGKVLRWDVHKGDYLTAGQKLGQFAPSGNLVAVTEVDELFAEKIRLGMKAEIVSQANGEIIGKGEVIFVAEFLKKKSLFSDESIVEDRRVKEVKVRLDPNSKLMINNRVDCTIYLKK